MKKKIFAALVGLSTILPSAYGQTTLPNTSVGATIVAGDKAKIADAPVQMAWPEEAVAARGYIGVDYLLWWARRGPTPPLVTTGPATGGATLAAPDTVVLFGGSPVNYGAFSGMRVFGGMPIGDGTWSLEAGIFFLGQQSEGFNATSNAAGEPQIARPFFNAVTGAEASLATSFPGSIGGSIDISTTSRLFGWEFNFTRPSPRSSGSNVDWLLGFRALDLREDLSIRENFTPLAAGVVTFAGMPVAPGDAVSTFDRFQASTRFYGPQVGSRFSWRSGRLSLDLIGKLALGVSDMRVDIEGSSLHSAAAGDTTVAGGVLAQSTNIGRHFSTRFAVVPEVGLNLGLNLTDRLSARFGYQLIYLSEAARPGNQVDRTLEDTLIPTGPFFGPTGAETRPRSQVTTSDYWAQGLHFGVTFSY